MVSLGWFNLELWVYFLDDKATSVKLDMMSYASALIPQRHLVFVAVIVDVQFCDPVNTSL